MQITEVRVFMKEGQDKKLKANTCRQYAGLVAQGLA